jgi:hypothetical protein
VSNIETVWQMREFDKQAAKELAYELEIPLSIAQIMAYRKITSVEMAEDFFNLKINKLHNPMSLPDAKTAIERISKAIDKETDERE